MSEDKEWKPSVRPEVPCRKCGTPGHIEFRIVVSSCRGFEDTHLRCNYCNGDWWVDGGDS